MAHKINTHKLITKVLPHARKSIVFGSSQTEHLHRTIIFIWKFKENEVGVP